MGQQVQKNIADDDGDGNNNNNNNNKKNENIDNNDAKNSKSNYDDIEGVALACMHLGIGMIIDT
ncbi:hypothetical protein MJO29_016256 [Puccinia striiformis f. sp. tritici]|nr:hypothetical protein MJO29_016256 [Puccinia striiformis f. sp. tritici]